MRIHRAMDPSLFSQGSCPLSAAKITREIFVNVKLSRGITCVRLKLNFDSTDLQLLHFILKVPIP